MGGRDAEVYSRVRGAAGAEGDEVWEGGTPPPHTSALRRQRELGMGYGIGRGCAPSPENLIFDIKIVGFRHIVYSGGIILHMFIYGDQ